MFKKAAAVSGDFYEFSDEAFANYEHQPEETVDFVFVSIFKVS